MKKQIITILLVLISNNIFSDDFKFDNSFFEVVDINGNKFYLDQNISEIENIYGYPDYVEVIEYPNQNKSEFDTFFWEYDFGISFQFQRSDRKIIKICIETALFATVHGLVKPLGQEKADIFKYFGPDYTYRQIDDAEYFTYYISAHDLREDFRFGSFNIQFKVKEHLKAKKYLIDEIIIYYNNGL